jgi:hypothetical protein
MGDSSRTKTPNEPVRMKGKNNQRRLATNRVVMITNVERKEIEMKKENPRHERGTYDI